MEAEPSNLQSLMLARGGSVRVEFIPLLTCAQVPLGMEME